VAKELQDIHRSNLGFLLDLKGATGILHNLIHDNLALMAIARFATSHSDLKCIYTNAGHAGFDIKGWRGRVLALVAEVKTTLPNADGELMGPQLKQIRKDLERLRKSKAQYRYLVLLAASTDRAVRNQLPMEKQYKGIKLLDAFQQQLVKLDEVE
jgi:hypothetical protein